MSDNLQSVPWLPATVIVLTLVVAISATVLAGDQRYLALTSSGEPGMVAGLLVISFGLPLGMWLWLRRNDLMVVSRIVLLTGALASSLSGSLGEWWTTVVAMLFPSLCILYRRRSVNASREELMSAKDDTSLVPPN